MHNGAGNILIGLVLVSLGFSTTRQPMEPVKSPQAQQTVALRLVWFHADQFPFEDRRFDANRCRAQRETANVYLD